MEYRPASISSHIEDQFPNIYRAEGPDFIALVKSYYEFLDQSNTRNFSALGDIDNTIESFLKYYKSKYLHSLPFPESSTDDIAFLVKNISDLYRSKGTQEALELMFKMFYKQDIETYYPSSSILKLSDSKWVFSTYLEFKPSANTNDFPVKRGDVIEGDSSKATAFVDEVVFYNISGVQVPVAYISNVYGKFTSDDALKVTRSGSESFPGKIIYGSLNKPDVLIEGGTADNKIGDKVKLISSKSGVLGEGVVRAISDIPEGSIAWELKDGGWGYDTSLAVDGTGSLISENKTLVSTQVLVVASEIDAKPGDTITTDFAGAGVFVNNEGGAQDSGFVLRGTSTIVQYEYPLLYVSAYDPADTDYSDPVGVLSQTAPYHDGAFHVRNQSDLSQIAEMPNGYEGVVALNGSTLFNITTLGSFNDTASYEIESYENTETVTFFTDTIGDFANTYLGHIPTPDGSGGYDEVLVEESGDVVAGNTYEIVTGTNPRAGEQVTWTDIPNISTSYINDSSDFFRRTDQVDHNYITGQSLLVTLTGSFNPFVSGTTYYVRVVNQDFFRLYNTQQGAVNNDNADLVQFTSSDISNATGNFIVTFPTIDFTHPYFGAPNSNPGTLFSVTPEQLVDNALGADAFLAGTVINRTEINYGMSGSIFTDYRTRLADALGSKTANLGSLENIKITSTGAGYTSNVRTYIYNDDMKKFGYGPLSVKFNVSNFDIQIGEIIEQTIQVPDLSTNSFGDFTSLNSTIDYIARGKLIGVDTENDAFLFQQLSFYPFRVGGSAIQIAGNSLSITSIKRLSSDSYSPLGENAVVEGRSDYLAGRITDVDITRSGFRYESGEQLSLVNNDETNTEKYGNVVGLAKADVTQAGITEGRWATTTSHLSDNNRYIHDNHYYQQYSYDVSTILDPTVYENTLKDVVHVAGTKFFGTPMISTNNDVTCAVDSTVVKTPTSLEVLLRATPEVITQTLNEMYVWYVTGLLQEKAPLLYEVVRQRDNTGNMYIDIVLTNGTDVVDAPNEATQMAGYVGNGTTGDAAVDTRIQSLIQHLINNASSVEKSFQHPFQPPGQNVDVFNFQTIELMIENGGPSTYASMYDALATCTLDGDGVDEVEITNQGVGYVVPPIVTFSAPPSGTTAQGTASITRDGRVSKITITNAGTGYTVAPTITINTPTETLIVNAGSLDVGTTYQVIDMGSVAGDDPAWDALGGTDTYSQGSVFEAKNDGGALTGAKFIPALLAAIVELPSNTIVDFD